MDNSPGSPTDRHFMAPASMAIAVAMVAFLIITLGAVCALFDSRLARRA